MENFLYLGGKIIVLGESLIKPNSINKNKKEEQKEVDKAEQQGKRFNRRFDEYL